jgi:predicted CXXCH cytochrome family protein
MIKSHFSMKGGFTVNPVSRSLLTKYSIIMVLLLVSTVVTRRLAQSGDYSFGDSVSKNVTCIACHGNQETVGSKNYINPTNFGHTTHAKFGCATCHDAITSSHPDGKKVTRTTSCGDCHADIITQYSASLHGAKTSCNGCHNPHRVYKPGEISAIEMNKQCAACHTKIKITASHAQWLPQTELHLGAISCVSCHSKAENYVITIYIAKRVGSEPEQNLVLAGYDELLKKSGSNNMQYLIDRNRDSYISLDELRIFNRDPSNKDLYLKAIFTPVKPTHSFQTFDNRWDCTFCHASGPEVMQTSYLSFPEQNGTFRQVAVEKGAAMDALRAIPNFYLMGSTRNGVLNKIGLLIIVGGMVMPVGHGFLRFLSRKNRQ